MSVENNFDSEADLRRYEALLEMADLMVHHRSLPELFVDLAERLHKVTSFEFATFSLYDPSRNVMKLHLWEGKELAPVHTETSVGDSPAGWVWQHQEPLILSDLQSDVHFLADLNLLKEKGIRSYCTLPLTTAQKRLGALGLGSSQADAFSAKDLRLLPRVAELVAVAVENALTREALQQEKDRLQMLLEVNTTLVSNRELEQLFPAISIFMRRMVSHDYASVAIYDEAAHSLSLYPLDSPLTQGLIAADATLPVRETPAGSALLEREAKIFNRQDLTKIHSRFVDQMLHQGIRSLCCIPLL